MTPAEVVSLKEFIESRLTSFIELYQQRHEDLEKRQQQTEATVQRLHERLAAVEARDATANRWIGLLVAAAGVAVAIVAIVVSHS